MEKKQLPRVILWVALLVTIAGAAGAYRFFRTAPELQAPQDASWWQLVPYAIGLLVIIALLIDWSSKDKNITL